MTEDWSFLGDVFYRKVEMCPMQWCGMVDLIKYEVAAAPYGGPIALVKKVNQTARYPIPIFSAAGVEIGVVQWNSGRLLKIGWSNREELLCLQDDGNVLVYNIFGKFMGSFGMGKEANEAKVVDGKIFTTSSGSTGIAVLTSTQRFYLVNNMYDVKLRQLADLPDGDTMPSSWCVFSNGPTPQLLAAKESTLYSIDIKGISGKYRVLKTNQIYFYTEMAVSFDNKYLALCTSLGILWIGSSDLKDTYCEFDTENVSKPNQLVWCGRSAVIAKWDHQILLVGPTRIHMKYEFDTPIHLVMEKDGVRIIGERASEFLQKVPRDLEDIFKIGSVSPGAMLFEASRLFRERNKEANDYTKIIKDDLPQASLTCLRAAGYQLNPEKQKALLKAASFGKSFVSGLKAEEFVDIHRKLRILNSLRSPAVGIPLTIVQLNHLTMEVLINRLLMRKIFWLAFEICKYLKMPHSQGVDNVLSQWACDKIQNCKVDDDQLSRMIQTKFTEGKGISYTEVINKAIECSRCSLALNLINLEPSATKQIPLLLKLNLEPEAMTKAIESGDIDLIALVLVHWKDKLQQGDFLRTISFFPTAYALHLQQCREQGREMLLDVHYQSDDHLGEALSRVGISYENQKPDQKVSNLVAAREAFEKGKKETFAKLTEDQIKLVKHQIKLGDELDRNFIDMSLNGTLRDLLLRGNHRHFELMRKEFKIPDKRLWSMKIQAFAEAGNWTELEKFSRSKKSPVGYEPFLDACIKFNNQSEAQQNYLSRVSAERLVGCHLKLGQLDEAAELAIQSKNEDDLDLVLSKCTPLHKAVTDKINAFKSVQFRH